MSYNKKYIQHGIVQCDPMPNQQELGNYYKEKYYQEGKGSYETSYTEEEVQHKIYECELIIQSIMNFIDSSHPSKYNFLELGCGEGFLLSEAHKAGFDVLGVDHSEFGITKCHPDLIDYFLQTNLYSFLENKDYTESFDFCALKSVLEHVSDPVFLLNSIKKVLKPDGKLIITVPNDYSAIQNKLLDFGYTTEAGWFCPPDHLFYFNTINFPLFVNDLGFKIVDLYTSFPVDIFLFNKCSNYELDNRKGKEAHFARIKTDLLIKESGLQKSLNLYRAMAQCGIGRNLTAVLSLK